ncbi:MAG: hypothetical protein COV29_01120 [Candidatus Yanofskybacteria bacterium CG10_big_fil_rev_8_21_14_0_10_36_16]|uniref:Peptidase M50 domain-containing protein n=1 Tax=Candidatus Yanofskybacteria bacterium CG10_big_fil_rev_8_21_14_0_10_36_16 TaxID=1975096 RepID=A0A2J0Q851_9BACT|nr:MAG: hypothetical protein COV29_01120 [Candidatus Yanofskybacteria bacterium CG10_big_fil_rev_8_21_14_0_10_36_16]
MEESQPNIWLSKKLILSIILSLFIFTFLLEKLFLSAILIFSLLIHEYGHYWQMGREGIKKRDMVMIPPLGAMAVSHEPWPSRGAEARIGIAGPIFGMIPAIVFYLIFIISGNYMWLAGVMYVCFVNLFNLLPIGPMDGGRCLKSVLLSINPRFYEAYSAISWIGIIFIFLTISWPIAVFIDFIFLSEEKTKNKRVLNEINTKRKLVEKTQDFIKEVQSSNENQNWKNEETKLRQKKISRWEQEIKTYELILSPEPMKRISLYKYSLTCIATISAYIFILKNSLSAISPIVGEIGSIDFFNNLFNLFPY